MSIVDGTGLVTWEGGLFEPDSDLLRRVQWAFAAIRADGGTIKLNEAGRPFGVYSDRFVEDAQDTASGRSTVHYQWGRFLRDETPSAADPAGGIYASEHTRGIAIDCNAAEPSLREKYFAKVGLENTIASESWHWAIRGPVSVDLSALASHQFENIENIKRKAADMILIKSAQSDRVALLGETSGTVFASADFSFEANKNLVQNIIVVATDDIFDTLVREAQERDRVGKYLLEPRPEFARPGQPPLSTVDMLGVLYRDGVFIQGK